MWITLLRVTVPLGLAVVIGAIGVAARAEAGSSGSASSYYLGRGDPRACPSPICGGVWVRLVNEPSTACADGIPRRECYVAEVDLTKARIPETARTRFAGLVSSGRALARGTTVRGRIEGFPDLATLVASEVWPASSSQQAPVGTFRLLKDNGVRCITSPCFSVEAALLNARSHVNVSRVDLARTQAPSGERRRALLRMATTGLIAAGRIVREPRAGPAGAGRTFVATQFYVRAGF